jgi:hypothetical protein
MDDKLHDDLLNFRDSDRESLASLLAVERTHKLVDTPTKLVNESNDFITMVSKAKNS